MIQQLAYHAERVLQHPIARGQLVSLLIAGTALTSSLLAHRGSNFPTFQSFFNYALLSLYIFRASVNVKALHVPWYYYAVAAVIDLEANFLVVKAYQYTSITSVMLLDCFTIPCAMILSRVFLKAQYNKWHIIGVCACLVGLVCIVLSDAQASDGSDFPNAVLGDILCLCGAMLYATSNVLQEFLVKHHSRDEYLGFMGAFGTLFSFVQSMALEHEAISKGSDYGWDITAVSLLAGFVGFLFLMYTQTSLFLAISDAALFNLSLLTSDLYAVLFAFLLYGYLVGWMYVLALAFIAAGIYIYYSQPEPSPPPLQRVKDGESLDGSNSDDHQPSAGSPRRLSGRTADTVQLLAHDTLVEPHELYLESQA